jgi:hypothetical protein
MVTFIEFLAHIILRGSPCHLLCDNMSECINSIYSTVLLLSGFVNPNFAYVHSTPIICASDIIYSEKVKIVKLEAF